jgi:hypothetical protein
MCFDRYRGYPAVYNTMQKEKTMYIFAMKSRIKQNDMGKHLQVVYKLAVIHLNFRQGYILCQVTKYQQERHKHQQPYPWA